MTGGGLASARLARMHDVMVHHVERGEVSGLAWLVARRGDVHVGVAGTLNAEASEPVRQDTILRISSMTKPITATTSGPAPTPPSTTERFVPAHDDHLAHTPGDRTRLGRARPYRRFNGSPASAAGDLLPSSVAPPSPPHR